VRRADAAAELARVLAVASLAGEASSLRELFAYELQRYAAWREGVCEQPPERLCRLLPVIHLRGMALQLKIPGMQLGDWSCVPIRSAMHHSSEAVSMLVDWTALAPEKQLQVVRRLRAATSWLIARMERHAVRIR